MRDVELPEVPDEVNEAIFFTVLHQIEAGASGPEFFQPPLVDDLARIVMRDSGLPIKTEKQRAASMRITLYALGRFAQDRKWA